MPLQEQGSDDPEEGREEEETMKKAAPKDCLFWCHPGPKRVPTLMT
jgi:hypothetical protein